MNPTDIDPGRLDAILASLGRWRLLARDVKAEAAGHQQTINLELLQSTRHLAAGLDALGQLEEQHRRSAGLLRTLEASARHAAQRVSERSASLQRIADAATRIPGAAAVGTRVLTELAELESAARSADRSVAELSRLTERHRRDELELRALRVELIALLAVAARGLAGMTAARRVLDESSEAYEAAQVSANDLRRDLRFARPGDRFAPPTPPATGASTAPLDDPAIVVPVGAPVLQQASV